MPVEYKKLPLWKKILFVWTYDGSRHFADWLYGWAFDPIIVLPPALLSLAVIALVVDPDAVEATLAMVVVLSPIWLPVYLGQYFWTRWIHYIRYLFWFNQEHVLLEVQLPPEVEKTPAAMELFLTSLFVTSGETTIINRAWGGKYRPVWALEIASNEGQIKFYIHMRKAWRNIIEAKLYGQFPEARVTEAEDYAAKVPFNLNEYDAGVAEFRKGKPQAFPIMTYVNYGLHMNPDKPEIQVDPITSIVELLGQIGPGEHFWFQIVMKARKKDEWYAFYDSTDAYAEEAKKAIQEITKGAIERAQALTKDDKEKERIGARGAMLLTGGEKERVEAIERQLNKNVFECGIRVIYLAKKENFNGINVGGVGSFFQAFRQPEYNFFIPTRGTF